MKGDPFMTDEDLTSAKASRDRQVVVYTDDGRETDEAKVLQRTERRERTREMRKEKKGVEMSQPIIDPKTGVVSFPAPEAGKAVSLAVDMAYIAVPKDTVKKLTALASKDGWKADAETEKGKANQATKVARLYILMAIDMLLEKRSVPAPAGKPS